MPKLPKLPKINATSKAQKVILTVGLGFGDEGKGATVDFLTRQHQADLVLRYCGGSQAGHNVELPDGRRHTFSQFGAGTLAGLARSGPPRTFLGANVVIDPPALLREAQHLAELGVTTPLRLVILHPRCLIATRYHRVLNQARELARGEARHGSCGRGIGETRHYWLRYGEDAVFAANLANSECLRGKLELLRQRTLLELQSLLPTLAEADRHELDLWNLEIEEEAQQLQEALIQGVSLSADIPEFTTAIFEGAQGVLLDEYRGFHPHTTWSTVTLHHAWEMLAQCNLSNLDNLQVLGITRGYITRHGNGPLPTESAELRAGFTDPGNPWNPWQGHIRPGWLDLPLLRYALSVVGRLDGLVINHLDKIAEKGWPVCEAYRGTELTPAVAPDLTWQEQLTRSLELAEPSYTTMTGHEIIERLDQMAPVVLLGRGPTCQERAWRIR